MAETRSKVLRHGPYKIIIHRPELTDRERTKRENQIKASLESVMREYLRRKELQK